MPKSSTRSPRIEDLVLRDLAVPQDGPPEAGDHREGELYSSTSLDGLDLGGISFSECLFEGTSLNETQLRGARFRECRFTELFAPVFAAARSSWRNVWLEGTRWGSAELYNSTLESVRISGGKLDFLNLRSSTLTDVDISDCIIGDLDLTEAKGVRVALRNCRINTLTLTGSRLRDVDLRTTEFRALTGPDGLGGVTIDSYQLGLLAPILAENLGLLVED
ncbi:pentapeptide repeat-containing protein [Arthrobacter frigidicola]|nr:pentapeptide repeat-containing protein [Arthrobacter frigidicola]